MSQTLSDATESVLRDPLTLLLTGLGITFHPYEYLGGLFLALAGASLASVLNKDKDRRSFWLVMLSAFFVAHIAVLVVTSFWPGISVQLVMAAAGFGSRYAARLALRVFGLIEERGDKIADRIVDKVLPPDKGDP